MSKAPEGYEWDIDETRRMDWLICVRGLSIAELNAACARMREVAGGHVAATGMPDLDLSSAVRRIEQLLTETK